MVIDQLVNISEHLAAKGARLFPTGVGGDQNRLEKRVNIGITVAR